MNQLDLLSIRTFYRQWIHSKASERSGVVISIGPDPILNRLEGPSGKELQGLVISLVEFLKNMWFAYHAGTDFGAKNSVKMPISNSIYFCTL